MKNYRFYTRTAAFFLLFIITGVPLFAASEYHVINSDTANYRTYHGKLVDKLNNQPVV